MLAFYKSYDVLETKHYHTLSFRSLAAYRGAFKGKEGSGKANTLFDVCDIITNWSRNCDKTIALLPRMEDNCYNIYPYRRTGAAEP